MGKKGVSKSLDLDPDLLAVLKTAIAVSDALDKATVLGIEVLKVRDVSKAVKKWKEHCRIFKE